MPLGGLGENALPSTLSQAGCPLSSSLFSSSLLTRNHGPIKHIAVHLALGIIEGFSTASSQRQCLLQQLRPLATKSTVMVVLPILLTVRETVMLVRRSRRDQATDL